jgi:SAM-dependent methyltransferase
MLSDISYLRTAEEKTSVSIREFEEQLGEWIQRGGPHPRDYGQLNRAIRRLGDEVRAGHIQHAEIRSTLKRVALQHFQGTMQGASILKKHGYSGDFEIIDQIYQVQVSADPMQRRWDLFFHAQSAPNAVRNRKAYFHQLLRTHAARCEHAPLRVLNIASGPARDLREWFDANPDASVQVDCIELDPQAIAFSKQLCARYLDRIQFHHQNALRFVPEERYDLIWSAGLFDYLTDRLFVRLVRSLRPFLKPGGELVVGNFSELNASRDYMELMGDWFLEHRSEEKLAQLAQQAGARPEQVRVMWEPEGVNLFVHVND